MKTSCILVFFGIFSSSCSTNLVDRTISNIVTLDSPMTELPKNTIFRLKHYIEISKTESMTIWFDGGYLSKIKNKTTGCYLLLNSSLHPYKINPGEFKLLSAELAPHNPAIKNSIKKIQISFNDSNHIYGVTCKFSGDIPTIRQFSDEINGNFELFLPTTK